MSLYKTIAAGFKGYLDMIVDTLSASTSITAPLATIVTSRTQQPLLSAPTVYHAVGAATLAAANVVNGSIIHNLGTAANTVLQLPNAAGVLALMPGYQVGDAFDFVMVNYEQFNFSLSNSGDASFTIANPILTNNNPNASASTSRLVRCVITGANAIVAY